MSRSGTKAHNRPARLRKARRIETLLEYSQSHRPGHPNPRHGKLTLIPQPRVADWIFRICLLDEAARRENTTFVINRGVIRRGCPTLSERKDGLFFACDAEKSETTVRNGRFALHFGARPPSGRHVRLLRTPAALVKRPRDWPWSSRPYYAKGENGPRRIDPAG